jgi:phosphate transporter
LSASPDHHRHPSSVDIVPTTAANLDGYSRPAPVPEEFELEQLPPPAYPVPESSAERQRAWREERRARKRQEKLERLRQEAEMKFSHSLQFNAVPDWTNHYIAYSNLKKL